MGTETREKPPYASHKTLKYLIFLYFQRINNVNIQNERTDSS